MPPAEPEPTPAPADDLEMAALAGAGAGGDPRDPRESEAEADPDFEARFGTGAGLLAPMWNLLRDYRFYRLLYLSQLVSWVGEFLNMTACFTLLSDVSDKSIYVAAYLLCQTVPTVVLSPVVGPLADRVNRYSLMLLADVARAAVVPLLALVDSRERLWMFYAAVVVIYSFQALFEPSRQAVRSLVIPKRVYDVANNLEALTFGVSIAAGGATAGVVVSTAGYAVCFGVDAATYALSAAFVLAAKLGGAPVFEVAGAVDDGGAEAAGAGLGRKRRQGGAVYAEVLPSDQDPAIDAEAAGEERPGDGGPAAKSAAAPPGVFGMYVQGMRYLWRERDLFYIVAIKAVENIGLGIMDTAVPRLVKAHFQLHGSTGVTLGLMYGLSGLGSFSPALLRYLSPTPTPDLRRGWMQRAFSVEALGMVLMCWSPHLAVFLAGSVMWYACGTITYVNTLVTLQEAVPDAYRGRVFGFSMFMRINAHMAGGLLYSALTDLAGLSARQAAWPVVVPPAANALVMALWYRPWWRRHQARQDKAQPAG